MIDISTAQQLGNKMGIDIYSVIREYVQIVFLNEFYATDGIKKTIFKGGTALRLMFGSNRFSEDLDFTTNLDETGLDRVLRETMNQVVKQIPGAEVKKIDSLAGFSRKIYVDWGKTTTKLTVKLDFSTREEVIKVKSGVIKTELPVFSTRLISYLDPEEIMAEKVRAVMTRDKGRDIYDIWFLLNKGVEFDQDLIQKKMDYYKEKLNWKEFKNKVASWDQKKLDQDIRRFLPEKDRVVIPKLKELILGEVGTGS